MVVDIHVAIVRGRRSDLHFRQKINVVESAIFELARNLVTILSFTCCRVIVVEDIKVSIPRCAYKIVFGWQVFVIFAVSSPVNDARNVLILLFFPSLSLFRSGAVSFVVFWLFKSLFLHTVFYVKAIASTTLIANEKLTFPFIQTHACNVCLRNISVYILKASIGRVPNFDTRRVRRDKSVEDGIVEDTKTRVLVSQVVVNWFVVVVKYEGASSNDDSFRWLGHYQRIYFIKTTVQSLNCCVHTHVPNANHS